MSFVIIITENINWEIALGAPDKLNLRFIPGYKFVNPYRFSKAYRSHSVLQSRPILVNGNCQIRTNGLILEYSKKNGKPDIKSFGKTMTQLLKYLRFESKQTSINPQTAVAAIYLADRIVKGVTEDILHIEKISWNSQYLYTLATWKHLAEASNKIYKNEELPVYFDMLLEAYSSWNKLEFNKVVLFSTIAIESFLAHTYDKKYDAETKRRKSKSSLRMSENHDGRVKDPVWKALMDRTDFKKLLHEAPLYLLKRSLLYENENLYRSLIRLYSTRNKIVHWGAPAAHTDQLIELNEAGAYQSLTMAIAVLNWMGVRDYDFMLEKGFTEIDE